MNLTRYSLVAVVIVSIFAVTSCATNPATGRRQIMLISERQEIAMGAEYDPQLVASMGLYENPVLQAFLEEKVREMGLVSHRPHLKYHVRMLDSPVVNAFAVPGGYIYLTRGILAHFNNEAELIGVIGHEMGHITARHTVSRMSSQTLAQIALIGGMAVSETFRNFGEFAMVGMQLLFLRHSREHEREADRLGVEYTARLGYDANSFAEFFRLLQRMQLASEHGGIPTFLSTHPDPGNRYNDVKRDAATWKKELELADWKVNADSYLAMIDGMVFGDDPRQGFVDGNTFFHPEMKVRFNFPQSWKLVNSPTNVQIIQPDNKAMLILMQAPGNSLEEAAQQMLQRLNLTRVGSETGNLNGFNSLVTYSELRQENPANNQKVRTSFIHIGGGRHVAFHAVSLESDFQGFIPFFNTAQQTFSPLTDPARLNVKPDLLRVRKITTTRTVASTLSAFNVPAERHREVALLNNLSLTDMLEPGRYIKIVVKQ